MGYQSLLVLFKINLLETTEFFIYLDIQFYQAATSSIFIDLQTAENIIALTCLHIN